MSNLIVGQDGILPPMVIGLLIGNVNRTGRLPIGGRLPICPTKTDLNHE